MGSGRHLARHFRRCAQSKNLGIYRGLIQLRRAIAKVPKWAKTHTWRNRNWAHFKRSKNRILDKVPPELTESCIVPIKRGVDHPNKKCCAIRQWIQADSGDDEQ